MNSLGQSIDLDFLGHPFHHKEQADESGKCQITVSLESIAVLLPLIEGDTILSELTRIDFVKLSVLGPVILVEN